MSARPDQALIGAAEARFQQSVALTSPHTHVGKTDFTVYGRPNQAEREASPESAGRMTIAIYTGCASLHIQPTPDEARQLAALLIAAADTFMVAAQ